MILQTETTAAASVDLDFTEEELDRYGDYCVNDVELTYKLFSAMVKNGFPKNEMKLIDLTTRMFTHTGPRRGDVFAESSFAKQIALIESGFIPPTIKVGNLKSLRTVADVRDAVNAYYLLATINPQKGEYYNIGGNHTLEIGEILDHLLSLSSFEGKIDIQIDPGRLRPIDADLQVPDTTKFSNHTGWKPVIKFETTMLDLLNYWRDNVRQDGNSFLQR